MTPAQSNRMIPQPKGSAGRSGDTRPGYELKDSLIIDEDQYAKLRVSTFHAVYHVFDASYASLANCGTIRVQVLRRIAPLQGSRFSRYCVSNPSSEYLFYYLPS